MPHHAMISSAPNEGRVLLLEKNSKNEAYVDIAFYNLTTYMPPAPGNIHTGFGQMKSLRVGSHFTVVCRATTIMTSLRCDWTVTTLGTYPCNVAFGICSRNSYLWDAINVIGCHLDNPNIDSH